MKQRIFNLIILDESGSMTDIEKQAIDGVNETIRTIRTAQQRYEDQEHFVTFVSFNSYAIKTIYENMKISNVKEITEQDYCPDYCTPLYDAMGQSINLLRKNVAEDDVVLVTIITDGYENSSREYGRLTIRSLVESLKEKGWIFTYIGANQDVERVGSALSISNTLSFSADTEGTRTMFARENKARKGLYAKITSTHSRMTLADDYFDEDDDAGK